MSNISRHIEDVKRQLAEHAETYPRDILAWRQRFDELRIDLDRLNFARANPPLSSTKELLRT